jgi:hypothetical protein
VEHGVIRVYFIGGRFTARRSWAGGSPPNPLAEKKMKSKKSNQNGFALIELLLIIGIVLIILRFMYAAEKFEWENSVVQSLGIDPLLYRLVIGVGLACFVIGLAIKRRIRLKKNKRIIGKQ